MMKEIKYDTPFFNVVRIQHGKNQYKEWEISIWMRFKTPQSNLFCFMDNYAYRKVLSQIKRICGSKKYIDRGLVGVDCQSLCNDLAEYLNGLKREDNYVIDFE